MGKSLIAGFLRNGTSHEKQCKRLEKISRQAFFFNNVDMQKNKRSIELVYRHLFGVTFNCEENGAKVMSKVKGERRCSKFLPSI